MAKAGGEILVAAIDGVDVAKNGLTGGGKHGNKNDDRRAKGLRSDELGGAPVGGAFDIDAVSIEKLDFGVEVGEFGGVDSAILKDPVMNKGATFGDGGDDGEEWKIVDIEAGERHGVDFVDGGDETGLVNGEVDEAGAVVGGKVFWGFADVGTHGFENFKFDFEEFDGGATDGDFGMSDEAGGDETHGFDGVFGNMVVDV